MKGKIMDVVQPIDTWQRGYAHLEYLRADLMSTFATKIDVMQHIKLCNCSLDVMWPISAYPAKDFPYTCKRCLGGITKHQNDLLNQDLGGHGWDDDGDDMWDEV
jgi:hypothetical protein